MKAAYKLDTMIKVDESLCIGCGNCIRTCPAGLITKKEFPLPIENGWDFCIDCGHCVAVCPTSAMHQRAMGPEDCEEIDIHLIPKWDRVRQYLMSRRSIRGYINKPVEKEKILQLLDVARRAPNGANRQVERWVVINDPAQVHRAAEMTIEWMKAVKEKNTSRDPRRLHGVWNVRDRVSGREVPTDSRAETRLRDMALRSGKEGRTEGIMLMNKASSKRLVLVLFAAALFCLAGAAGAQEKSAAADAVAQANNPLANFTAFNLHDYYIGELTAPDDYANQVWLRFAQPFSIGRTNWLMRASLPIYTFPIPPAFDHKTGLSDLNVFAAYLIDTGNPTLSFGIGPQLTAPTATDDALGSEKWSLGLVNTLFSFASRRIQYGYLLSWQASVAGNDDRADVNFGGFQPFVFYQLGGRWYLRSTGVCSYNFENDTYSVPVGLGIGKVIPREKVIFNIFVEPQFSIADKGDGWPKWQIFVGWNNQF